MRFLLTFLVSVLLALSSHAEQSDSTSDSKVPQSLTQQSSVSNKDNRFIQRETSEEGGFGIYKPNYFLPGTWLTEEAADRQSTEIKFQISIKQKTFDLSGFGINFGYTQKSFWQAYDQNDSSPFRETNYNPEVFIDSPQYQTKWGKFKGFLGYEHESNGERLPYSRSWNRAYFRYQYTYHAFGLEHKIWYRIPEDDKKDANDPKGDDNPDIHEFFGYNEIIVSLNFEKIQIAVFGRYNSQHEKGAVQVDITSPAPGEGVYWYIQYWSGYGESLIDYNVELTKYGLGLMVKE